MFAMATQEFLTHRCALAKRTSMPRYWRSRRPSRGPADALTRLHKECDAFRNSSSLLLYSPPSQFVDFCPNCESSKDYEQNYIQMHDTLPIFPARSFCDRDATLPNHFRMRAWPFAVFARKSSLQAFRQNRRPQWLW